jgi:hypothetical protein
MKENKYPIQGSAWESNVERAVRTLTERGSFLFDAYLDPDSMGSMLALAVYLKLIGKKVFLLIYESVPSNLGFMESIVEHHGLEVLRGATAIERVAPEVEAVVFLDTANRELLPHFSVIERRILKRGVPVIEIDHHFGTDSAALAPDGIHLFREANASAEIVAELLERMATTNGHGQDPFSQRSILLSLLTGFLCDTAGGKSPPFPETYVYWTDRLEVRLRQETRWRKADGRSADSIQFKFGSLPHLEKHLNTLDDDQVACVDAIAASIVSEGGVALLNLLDSTYPVFRALAQPYHSKWFSEVRFFLLSLVPEKSGKVGMVFFNGKTAAGQDCIYLKMRRSAGYHQFDLRELAGPVRDAFPGNYLGGGGHASAVSFRINPYAEREFLDQVRQLRQFLKNRLA